MMSFFRSNIPCDTEENEVKKLLHNSYNFKKLSELNNKYKATNLNAIKEIVESLHNAKNFWDITHALYRFDPNDVEGAANWFEVKVVPSLVHTFAYFAGFVDDRANISYYSVNLFNEALNKMKEFPKYSDYLSRVVLSGGQDGDVLRANSMFYQKR